MKKPLVFSFVREQRLFLIALLALLSFLAVLCLGLVMSMGTAVTRWNNQWDLMATVQVLPGGADARVQKIITDAHGNIASIKEISTEESARMLRPWLSGGDALSGYIPKMTEIKFKNRPALRDMSEKISGLENVRFVTFAEGMRATITVGWKIITLSVLVLMLVLGSIVICISYITKNITLIHRRELEILNQVGARDGFVARQLMISIARLSAAGAGIGFIIAAPVLLVIIAMAQGMRVGMFTQMAIPIAGWMILCALAIGIIVLSIYTAFRTVMKILRN
ncbi:MAG: hypothetical protein FWG18_00930 [Alphaproteobacteria bacterium]|nr:hypothetical protein [Alphaproteobacteria bacterium]